MTVAINLAMAANVSGNRPSRLKKQNIRTLSLVVITLTYLIIGAAVFDKVESDDEFEAYQRLNSTIAIFKRKHNMNDSTFNMLWNTILEKKPHHAGNQWKFMGSLYFCTVVVALIGYGHSTPKTLGGKFFCVVYALIGVPIALIMFQSVGERLNSLIAFFLAKVKQKLKLKNQDIGLVELITVEAAFTLTITCIASYVFMVNEDWSYFDALYYCFITLTTIGFGDQVPMQKNNELTNNFPYACFTIMFILTGLITLASSMNLLVLRLATINAEEQVQEKLEAAERQAQAVRLEGDVINPRTQLFVTQAQEKPEQIDAISVCSCACLDYKLARTFSRKHRRKSNRQNSSVSHLKHHNVPLDNMSSSNQNRIFLWKQTQVKRLFGLKTQKKSNVFEMREHSSAVTGPSSTVIKRRGSPANASSKVTANKQETSRGDSTLDQIDNANNDFTNLKRRDSI